MSTLIVLRHGQADHNIQERYNSNPHNPGYFVAHLTELGKKQARDAGKQLLAQGVSHETIKIAYVSPLPRAIETANILVELGVIPVDFVIDDRLIEVNMGHREGHYYNEYPEDCWDHSHALEYHGELDSDVLKRVQSLLQEVRKQYPMGAVLFVTHGTPALELIKMCTGKKIKLNLAEWMVLEGA